MSQTESTLSPLSLTQLPPVPDDPTIQMLYRLLTWFRGDIRLTKQTQGGILASTNTTFDIEPPDNSEEWEILQVSVVDNAKIDATDFVHCFYRDEVLSTNLILGGSQLKAATGPNDTYFYAVYPFSSTNPATAYNPETEGSTGFIVKKRDNKASWFKFRVVVSTTATIGTRSLDFIWKYRRRRLI